MTDYRKLSWFMWYGLVVLLISAAFASCVEAQCPPGVDCPTRPPTQDWQAVRPRAISPAAQRPIPAICRVVVQRGRETVYGSGVLVWKRGGRAVVITAQHLIRRDCGHRPMCQQRGCNHRVDCKQPICRRRLHWDRIHCEWPNGTRSRGERVEADPDTDLGAIVIPAPDGIEPLSVYCDDPKPGDPVTLCGYGSSNQYRGLAGTVVGYTQQIDDGPAWDLIVSGAARGGDSGGPMLNAKGEIVGIIWGTDGKETRGSFCGALCQFVSDGKYKFPWLDDTDRFAPWNAKTEQEKIKAAADLTRPMAPPLVAATRPGEVIDVTARQRITDLAIAMQREDAATVAAIGGATDTAKQAVASVGDLADGLDNRIVEGAEAVAKPLILGWAKKLGFSFSIPGGIGLSVLFWVVFRVIKKDRAEYKSGADLSMAQSFTQWTPWTWDDGLGNMVTEWVYGPPNTRPLKSPPNAMPANGTVPQPKA